MTYTHFRKIIRDDNGLIDPQSGMTELAPRGVPGWPGMVQGYRVGSVEPGAIAGWGAARAIGDVQAHMGGEDQGEPFLALLA